MAAYTHNTVYEEAPVFLTPGLEIIFKTFFGTLMDGKLPLCVCVPSDLIPMICLLVICVF